MSTAADRLIVALDVGTVEAAEKIVEKLTPVGIRRFKIGLGLFTRVGPPSVKMVHDHGGEVFLDLKFHDIPSTVGRAVSSAAQLGVWMMNLHIQGGTAMMRQAAASVREESSRRKQKPPLLIGVTVLTSMSQKDIADLGLRTTLKDQVLYLAKCARSVGLDGIVASPQEALTIRWACGEDFLIVTPGIRPAPQEDPLFSGHGIQKDDQHRTATPAEAVKAGADYIVVGRPIVEAADPAQVAHMMVREMEAV